MEWGITSTVGACKTWAGKRSKEISKNPILYLCDNHLECVMISTYVQSVSRLPSITRFIIISSPSPLSSRVCLFVCLFVMFFFPAKTGGTCTHRLSFPFQGTNKHIYTLALHLIESGAPAPAEMSNSSVLPAERENGARLPGGGVVQLCVASGGGMENSSNDGLDR